MVALSMASGITAALSGCASSRRGPAVPAASTGKATVIGIPNERFFPMQGGEAIEKEFLAAAERIRRTRRLPSKSSLPEAQLLAISGGAENGAFGAGVLCGWSEYGSRPVFDLVTGVSTGAMTAIFAFLGPQYDTQLRGVYSDLTTDDVLRDRGLAGVLFNDAMADNTPLLQVIAAYMTADKLTGIAAGYEEGRLLLVATTHLDARQPVIWNIGAIAGSGDPRALDLVRHILLASAAVPGALPPSMIDVTLNGKPYQEMHVDGGAFAQAFLYPAAVHKQRRQKRRSHQVVPRTTAYIIRNGRLAPGWEEVERRTLGVASAAITTMITASGNNDINSMYNGTQRDDIDFNLAFIGSEFTAESPTPFDRGYMRALFDYGYQRSRRGYDWAKRPPF